MDDQLLGHLRAKLEARKAELIEFVADGGAKSYDHYKELTGQIRGLMASQYEIDDLVRKLRNDDDE